MLKILHQIFRTGIVTEPLDPAEEAKVTLAGAGLEKAVRKRFRRSAAIRLVDAGSCNGCELEISATCNPVYDAERFGISFTASPRFADILLVTGPVSRNMEVPLRRTYDAMPSPKLVVAVGDCGYNGGVFGSSYASLGGVGSVLSVDAYIHGCPPTPSDILNGLLRVIEG
ncbi:MAG: NADH-quinone oxidoreductase subunit B family protein [Deltaproteobacteria bacterium]|nr:NADH-quinone oxidoreductase subunit B family protein [Deltaproteobacteria bacterium]MCL4874728.1 NADH-quinone oxidoreductase subunit B family protein [bacterium]